MKKIIALLLILVLSLSFTVSCKNNNDENGEKTDVNVAVLSGSTGFGMAYLMEQNEKGEAKNNYTFQVQSDATVVNSALLNGDVDIAALPTNAASVLFNKPNNPVKVIAINTLGVLYVVENGTTITNISDLENKTIYCPAQNPAFILQYILNKNNISATIDTTYSTPALLNKAVTSGALKDQNVIAVLPEPVLTTATKANSSLSVRLDLTEEWSKVEDTQLVQGCVVVRTAFLEEHPEAVEKFLTEYEASINYLQNNNDATAALVVKHGIFANENVAKIAIPKCNVTYIDGNEMKSAMNDFLNALSTINIQSIGGKLPTDTFYYINEWTSFKVFVKNY